MIGADGQVLDTDVKRIGLRIVQLDLSDIHLPDERGKFCFIVNGEKIFVRGTNWVPLDALHSRDAAQYESAMKLVTDANCNMVRCWGGNVYEDTRFFDLCDENGILVWQDFAMGCSFYPQRADFLDRLREEVTSVVLKLRNHPSLALWAGNNEDDANLFWSRFAAVPSRSEPRPGFAPCDSRKSFMSSIRRAPTCPNFALLQRSRVGEGEPRTIPARKPLVGGRGDITRTSSTRRLPARSSARSAITAVRNRSSIEKMMTEQGVYPWTEGRKWNDEWITKSTRRYEAWGPTMDRNNLMLNQVNILFGSVPDDLDDFRFRIAVGTGRGDEVFRRDVAQS